MKITYTLNGEQKAGTVVLTTDKSYIIIPDDHTAYVIKPKEEVKKVE